jgi:PAS domain S-box-containing protein
MNAPAASLCPLGYKHAEIKGEDYYIFFDADRRWLRLSAEFCELVGYKSSELTGGTVDKLLPEGITHNAQLWADFLRTGYWSGLMAMKAKSGRIIGFRFENRRLADGCLISILKPLDING